MFKHNFKISFSIDDELVAEKYSQEIDLVPGTYERGLLTVVGANLSRKIVFDSWDSDQLSVCDVIAYTAFGDLFFVDKKSHLVSFFEVQLNRISEIGISVDVFFDDFLLDTGVELEILKTKYFNQILSHKKIEELQYGECLVLAPWQILGGEDIADNYLSANFPIYLDLVGQTK